jgi:hypothetical protein
LKYSDKHRTWKSIRSALRSIWSKTEIDALESRLNSYRHQLILQKVFAPDKRVEDTSLGKRFDSLKDSNTQVLSQLANLAKTLADVQDNQKNALSSAAAVPISKVSQLGKDDNSIDIPGAVLQDNANATEPHNAYGYCTVTSKQFEVLQARLERLQKQITEQPGRIASLLAEKITTFPQDPQVRKDSRRNKGDQASNSPEEASELLRALVELYRFTPKIGTALFSEDARLIIESLDKILEIVERASATSQLDHISQKRKRSSSPCEDAKARQQQKIRAYKRIRGLLNSSQSISVNQPGKTLY